MNPIKILVVGCGHMGKSHAFAYHKMDGFKIVGLVSRSDGSRENLASQLGGNFDQFDNFETALEATKPDAVSINTYPDTHAEYAIRAMNANCHVFVEKPLAQSLVNANEVIDMARKTNRKLVVGYILRHHPSYIKFVDIGKTLGKPLVMRMNLNQQSHGRAWETHKHLMESCSPIVDCGVHYVDLMCQTTDAKPVRVHTIGARLTNEIDNAMYNYGQMQIVFDDGSVGWFEAGWGPMISKESHFIKDFIGPKGSVSMVKNSHVGETKKSFLILHQAEQNESGFFLKEDQKIELESEPDPLELCKREQEFFLKAIHEDLDLTAHQDSALNSLRIVLAANKSWETGEIVRL